jgi:hypothetical protein
VTLVDALRQPPSVTGPLGSLALSRVRPLASLLALRAVRWQEGLERLGLVLPFFVVHDVGLLFAAPRDQLALGPRVDPARIADAARARTPPAPRLEAYGGFLAELGETEAARGAGDLRPSDGLVVALLARLLGAVAPHVGARPAVAARLPYDATLFDDLEPALPDLFGLGPRDFELAALEALEQRRLFVLSMADALDAGTMRLFGLLGAEARAGPPAEIDLLAALESPGANDVAHFSLEILPSVLEARARPAAGSAVEHGYAGVSPRGSIDSLVLTELAWDDDELARRIADAEVLYYAREQGRDESRRAHTLLVDASASMRGDRQTFARGMAIATGKKLLLRGEDVAYRFFDSRLYEVHRAEGGRLPLAHLLSFRGERGRNPARVFAQLAAELAALRRSDPRTPVVHVFTHAALYIPRELVQAVRAEAHLAAVFLLPSNGAPALDYLDLLDGYWVVDHATLAGGAARAAAARAILDEATPKTAPAAKSR